MTLRPVLPLAAVAAVTALLIGLASPPTAGGELPDGPGGPGDLPPCPAAGPAGGAAGPAPPRLPATADPTACRARPTRVEPAAAGQLPVPRPGYHHLGATTTGGWSGVLGRLAVVDPAVRAGSFDFVATRFMAKHAGAGGRVDWLEVGWAEPGWSGGGRQQIYTFDSGRMSWVFFDEYPIGAGDRIWVYLHSEPATGGAAEWRAWLWWDRRWQLLAAPQLPGPDRAQLEQYVEVHQERAGPPVPVPPVRVDNVAVRDEPDKPLLPWRADRVPSASPATSADYCLIWQERFDSWSAGDCPATVQE